MCDPEKQMHCYLALLWEPADRNAELTAKEFIAREELPAPHLKDEVHRSGIYFADFSSSSQKPGALRLCTQCETAGGLIYGRLFARSASLEPHPPLARISDSESKSIIASNGLDLYAKYWGAYIAILRTPDGHLILSDPAASVPCYLLQRNGVTFSFSHLEQIGRAHV